MKNYMQILSVVAAALIIFTSYRAKEWLSTRSDRKEITESIERENRKLPLALSTEVTLDSISYDGRNCISYHIRVYLPVLLEYTTLDQFEFEARLNAAASIISNGSIEPLRKRNFNFLMNYSDWEGEPLFNVEVTPAMYAAGKNDGNQGYANEIYEVVGESNRLLPVRMYEGAVMDSIKYDGLSTVTYYASLFPSSGEVLMGREEYETGLKQRIIEQKEADEGLKWFVEKELTLVYEYLDSKGGLLYRVEITPDMFDWNGR